MTDGELLEMVTRDRLVVDPNTGRIFEGNARAYELRKRLERISAEAARPAAAGIEGKAGV